jgi:serine/threonine protein phosphatase PrpC
VSPSPDDPLEPGPLCFNHTLESMVFYRNHCDVLPIEIFLYYPKLRFVDFAENQIHHLSYRGVPNNPDLPPHAYPNRILDLNLSCNRLSLPAKSSLMHFLFEHCLSSLNRLDLCMNNLRRLPKVLGNMSTLEQLNFSFNYVTKFPSTFSNLQNLKILRASYNHLAVIPNYFVSTLTALHELALQGNPITALPDLAALPSLVHLSVSLPPEKFPQISPSTKRLYVLHAPSSTPCNFVEQVRTPIPVATATSYSANIHPAFRTKNVPLPDYSHKLPNIPLIYGGLPIQECITEAPDKSLTCGPFSIGFSHMMGSMCKDEDRIVIDLAEDGSSEWSIVGICDGHGGSDAVQFISRQLAPILRAHIEMLEFRDNIHEAIRAAFAACNTAVYSHLVLNGDHDDLESGCTCVVLLIRAGRLICANIGDSRCVFFDHLTGPTPQPAVRLSLDHKPSLPEEILRIQTQGGIVVGDLMSKGYRISHPRSGHSGAIAVTRSFGDFGLSPLISSEPYIRDFTLPTHDAWSLVLASDGVFDVFPDELLQQLHQHSASVPQHITGQGFASLVREASYLLNSRDDISVIHITPKPDPTREVTLSPRSGLTLQLPPASSSGANSHGHSHSVSSSSSHKKLRSPRKLSGARSLDNTQ